MAELRDSFLMAMKAYLRTHALQVMMAPARCCPGRIADGPAGCTCWRPVFDLDQADPDPATVIPIVCGTHDPETRPTMCGDCAYRPGSPEKTGGHGQEQDTAALEHLAATGERFYCHDGFPVPIAWRHPAGMRIPVDPERTGDYQPKNVLGIPLRADGTPGLLCAGWAARRRALAAADRRE